MAGLFSSAILEQIRAASDIVDVIGSYLPLKRAGANFVALCPFHKEKSPSFNVNPHRQIFHCFGCHKGGDVFTFVKEYESIDFVESVKRLADRAKIPLEYEQGGAGQETKHLKETLLKIHEQIAQRWHHCLLNEAAGQVARDYLARRGVSAEAIKLFRIGAAPDAWDDTVNWTRSKDYDLETVEKAGLIIRKAEDGGQKAESEEGTSNIERRRFYDRFRGRLMFPICDEQGRVIGFSGRVLSGDEKTAKYVNSPETPIFTKSKVFFGLDKSKRAILDAGYAIICEGQLDLIACFMGGVQNIVAPQGTAFTDQHARILKRYADEAVLCFDSDEAGQNAIVRSLDHLLASGLAVRVAVVPKPHDPDSFIKANGGEAFRKLIENAEGFFDYYLNRLCATNDAATDKGRQAILQGMAEAVYKTGNKVLIDTYAKKTAYHLGVTPEAVAAEFKKLNAKRSEPISEPPSEQAVDSSQLLTDEEFCLLKFLMETDEHVAWIDAHLDVDWIGSLRAREIVAKYLESHRSGAWESLNVFLQSFEDDGVRQTITEALTAPLIRKQKQILPNPAEQLKDIVRKLRNDFIDRRSAALLIRLSNPNTSDADRVEFARERLNLLHLKRMPIAPLK